MDGADDPSHGEDFDKVPDFNAFRGELLSGSRRGLFRSLGTLAFRLLAQFPALIFHGLAVGGSGLFRPVQIPDGRVVLALGVSEDVRGLFIGLLQDVFPLLFKLLFLLLQLFEAALKNLILVTDRIRLALGPAALPLQVSEQVFEGELLCTHIILCLGNDGGRNPQAFCDGQGVGLARQADDQAVGGREGLLIKLHRGVLDALRRQGVRLELGVVGREHGGDAAGPHVVEDGGRQGGALGRVRAGAELVEEDQVMLPGVTEDVDDILHVAGEGGQGFFNRLGIADVGKDFSEYGQACSACRHKEAGLGHDSQQTQGLQRHGLAAGVGTGDDQDPVVAADFNVNGDGLFRVQEGMAGSFNLQRPSGPATGAFRCGAGGSLRCRRIFRSCRIQVCDIFLLGKNFRLHRPHLFSQAGPGEDEVEGCDGAVVPVDDLLRNRAGGGKRGQNPADFVGFFFLFFADGIIRFDGLHGLDVEGLARGGSPMDDAGHPGLELGPDRKDEAVVPGRDQGVGEKFRIVRKHPLQGVFDLII